jgi:hypothetical protein
MRVPLTRHILELLALVFFGTSLSTVAATDPVSTKSLRGIKTVDVIIENLSDNARKFGLSEDAFKADVELRLRQSGMQVSEGGNAEATFYVNVNCVSSAVAIDVNIDQAARLTRNPSVFVVSTTWSTGGLVGNPSGSKAIRDYLLDMVDRFLNAWLSVNPRAR